jgi:ABC-type sugar transport system ATPase subunit
MIYVTHEPVEAMTLGDRLAIMDHGRLLQAGTPEEIFRRPINRFVAGFVGWPAMNFIDGELQTHDGQMVFAARPGKLPVPTLVADRWAAWAGAPVTLGIRPEDVEIGESTWTMWVKLVEALGHSTLVTLSCQDLEMTAWLRGGCHFSRQMNTMAAETTVMVRLALANGHLFDRVSGAALAVRASG